MMNADETTTAGNMQSEEQRDSILGIVIQDVARLNRVAATVAQYGFGELLTRSQVGRTLFRSVPLPEQTAEQLGKPPAVRFRQLLEALGPTYIKLGQILSTRADMVPADFVEELQRLQDTTVVLPFEDIREVVEHGLGLPLSELFEDLQQEPLGTASIAQAYRATTLDGDAVVVKVQRPGLQQVVRGDLDLLYLGAKILEATIDEMQLYSPSDIVAEFERALLQELDFNNEFKNLVMARNFLDADQAVTVPKPYPELSCRTVLTMEFFEGIPLRKLEPNSSRAHKAAEQLLHTSFKQVMYDGFFHGDPHPGNLLINEEDVLCMIDLGMMGSLSPAQREDLVLLVLAAFTNDDNSLARTLIRMGNPTRRINMGEFKAEIRKLRGEHLMVDSLDEYDSTAFSLSVLDTANRFGIKVNPQYSVLAKSAATVEGIVRTLHPQADLIGIARPYAEQILREQYSPRKLMEEATGGLTGIGSLLRVLPDQLDQLLHDVETGNLQVRLVSPAVEDIAPGLHRLGGRITLGLFATAMSLSGAMLIPDQGSGQSISMLGGAAIALSMMAWSVLLLWHLVGDGKKLKLGPWLKFFKR